MVLIGLENENKIVKGCPCYMLFSGVIVYVLTFYDVMLQTPLFSSLVLVSNVFTMFYSFFLSGCLLVGIPQSYYLIYRETTIVMDPLRCAVSVKKNWSTRENYHYLDSWNSSKFSSLNQKGHSHIRLILKHIM
jgi:hypothetical protein